MPGLYPFYPLAPGETPPSYVSALAPFHGAATAREFCLDMGLSFQGIVDGEEAELHTLADLAGVPFAELAAGAFRRGEGVFTLAGQRLAPTALVRSGLRVCPACVLADRAAPVRPGLGAVYGRARWQLEPLRRCPCHGTAVVNAASARPHLAHDFALLASGELDRIRRLAEETETLAGSGLEDYLVARLAGGPARLGWLDGLAWHAAARTAEMIGVVMLFGRKARPRLLTDADWHRAGAAGFEVASGGEAAILAFLGDLRREYSSASSGNEGVQATYGVFHLWLAARHSHPDLDPVRDLVFRHVQATFPVGPDDTLFGRAFPVRRLHSIRTASLMTGTHPKRLRKVLAAANLLPQGHEGLLDHHVLFDAETAEPTLTGATDTISLAAAAKLLGVGMSTAHALVDAGLIARSIRADGTARGIGMNGIPRRAVDGFLKSLAENAIRLDTMPTNARTIRGAARATCRSTVAIAALIRGHKLSWVGRLDGKGLEAFAVDIGEVRSLLREPEMPGLSSSQVVTALRTSHTVMKALLDNGILPVQRVLNPTTHAMIDIVPHETLDYFKKEYISLQEIAGFGQGGLAKVAADLRSRGILPAFDPSIVKASFFRRSDLL